MLLVAKSQPNHISGSATFVFLERLPFSLTTMENFNPLWQLRPISMGNVWRDPLSMLWTKTKCTEVPLQRLSIQMTGYIDMACPRWTIFSWQGLSFCKKKQVHASPLCKGGPCVIYKVPPAHRGPALAVKIWVLGPTVSANLQDSWSSTTKTSRRPETPNPLPRKKNRPKRPREVMKQQGMQLTGIGEHYPLFCLWFFVVLVRDLV